MKRRGIALIIVLTLAAVIVLMTGAFVVMNQANFSSLAGSQRQRESQLAADSAIAYVRYRLEQDENWAANPFPVDAQINPPGPGLEVSEVHDSCTIRGKLTADAAEAAEPTFEVDIVNNLPRAASSEFAGLTVPARRALLRVRGRSGMFENRCDLMLQAEPLYDASLTANQNIQLDKDIKVLRMKSADPMRNLLRSNASVLLGDFARSGGSDQVEIGNSGQPGVVWARGDITTRQGGENRLNLEGELLSYAEQKSGGKFASRSRSFHDIYKLQTTDLKFPAGNPVRFPPGAFIISKQPVAYEQDGETRVMDVDALAFYPETPGEKMHIWYDKRVLAAFEDSVTLPSAWNAGVVCHPCEGGRADINGYSGDPAMVYRFDDNRFRTVSTAPIQVDGNLGIWSTIKDHPPDVRLNAENAEAGVINCTGSVQIMGTVSGGGAVVADQDLLLMAKADLESKVDSGVVLYAKNVVVAAGAKKEVSFKGLVYAKENIHVAGGIAYTPEDYRIKVEYTNDHLDKIRLEGAVVAQAGHIYMADTNEVDATYNEDYLRALTKGLPNGRRRLSQLWKLSR